MKQINILVTGIGGPTAQGVLRGLGEMEDVRIIGADRREFTAGHQFCHHTYQIPRYTAEEDYCQTIKNIIEKDNIHIIFPSLHEELTLYHTHQDEFDAVVAIPKSNRFPDLLNKESTYQYLSEKIGTRYIPKYQGFNTKEELQEVKAADFPDADDIVVKLVSGHGALGFAVLTDKERYLTALRTGRKNVLNIDDYYQIINPDGRKIAMEYIDGQEYSVDVFLHDGKVVTALPRERSGVSNGIVLEGTVVEQKELIEAATEITTALATDGFINVQFMESSDGFLLTDINPRFCGSQVMSLGAGVNFPALFIKYMLLGEQEIVTPRWNTKMIRFRDQLFIEESKETCMEGSK